MRKTEATPTHEQPYIFRLAQTIDAALNISVVAVKARCLFTILLDCAKNVAHLSKRCYFRTCDSLHLPNGGQKQACDLMTNTSSKYGNKKKEP